MINIDFLRRNECQPLTQEQMTEIKSQFHPSNTANVNITPYHIYDEDEHIVGEWRETINGVKKKKPVYEKRFHGQAYGGGKTNYAHQIENVGYIWLEKAWFSWDGQNVFNNNGGCNPMPVVGSANNINSHVFVVDEVNNTNIVLWFDSNRTACSWTAFVRYTKTTDEWEEV